MAVFQSTFEVGYAIVEPDLHARIPGIMGYVQEASIKHTESTAHKMQWYADNMRGWLLTGWHIEIHKRPRWNDTIAVRTWPSKFRGILADRSFEVADADGERLISAMSAWVYTDIERRRPMKPPQEVIDGYGEVLPPVMEANFKIPDWSGFEKAGGREMAITRRDTDTNYHVNNIRYIEWAFDEIPSDIYDQYDPSVIKVAYRKECKAGEAVVLESFVQAGARPAVVITVRKAAEPETIATEIYTEWVRKG